MIINVLPSSTCIMLGLGLSSIYLWRKLYKSYISLKEELLSNELFLRRHNCVCMYSRNFLRGWPPNESGIPISLNAIDLFLEPFLYFISTAKVTLDISMMMVRIPKILVTLFEAQQRGVKVRVMVNFYSVKGMQENFTNLRDAGVETMFYIGRSEELDNIMHHKCMIKDYMEGNGFLYHGSMNLSNVEIFHNNFEDVIFTTQTEMVTAFHSNFNKCWKMIEKDNQHPCNKSILDDYFSSIVIHNLS